METATMRAELKRLYSPDVEDLEKFMPEGPFGILVQALIGPANGPGEESFDILVCTPEWLGLNMTAPILLGRHYLFVKSYNFQALQAFIQNFCSKYQGNSWAEIAHKLSRLGYWEFEDYKP